MEGTGDDLSEKAAAFRQLEQGGVSDDEFDAAELEVRRRSRAFFLKEGGRTRPSSGQGRQTGAVNEDTKQKQKQKLPEKPLPKRRVSSAPTPVSGKVIKGTPASVAAQRNSRLQRVLQGHDSPAPGDESATIPESARPAARALRRSESTPVTVTSGKRLQMEEEEGTPSRGIAPPKKRRTSKTTASSGTAEQIFRDLSFHYIPDNDIAPARRIRITKAKENGASWTRFPKFATHVIVDKNIRYDEIRHLVTGEDGTAGPIVVNEDYPIDCVQFRAVLDPFQRKYQLAGQPEGKDTARGTAASSEERARSLPLKAPQRNPKKWDYVPPDATPDRTSGESLQASQGGRTSVVGSSQPIVIDLEEVTESSPRAEAETRKAKKGKRVSTVSHGHERRGGSSPQPVTRVDELSDYISLMQQYKDVPLDADDEDDLKSVSATDHHSDEGSGSDEDRLRKKRQKSSRRRVPDEDTKKKMKYAEQFACNRAGPQDASADNPNVRTIEVLQKMASYYDQINDHWRTTAYRKAISTLKRQQVKIATEDEAFRLPSVGRRLAQKIEEIVTTDRLQRLEYAQMDPRNGVLQLFLGIYGVGTSQAQQWISQGFRTLDDLRDKAKLTTNQQVGIDHYDDLNTKIPRREVEALGEVVKQAAARIDPEVEMIIGGSYRRGAERSSDIDFIVTKGNTKSTLDLQPFLDNLVRRLTQDGFLVARLASSRAGGADGGSKWHGCCVLPRQPGSSSSSFDEEGGYKPVWRRIDFLVVPETEIGAALIYFTGNDIFNRSMRLLASRKGMRLNQRGLYKDVMRGPARVKVTEGELLEGRDERRIFEILGVQWREPHERWC